MSSPGEMALVRNLNYLAEAQAVTSNNLANVNAHGFKRRVAYPVQDGKYFDEFLQSEIRINRFNQDVDYEVGDLNETKDKSNVALRDKEVFFRVQSPEGTRSYARVHTLAVDSQNRLTTTDGDLLLDEQDAPLLLQSSEGQAFVTIDQVNISPQGVVTVGNSPDGKKLGLYRATDIEQMIPYGGGRFVYEGAQPLPLANTNAVTQRFVEKSNVNAMSEMVSMIVHQRSFQSSMSSLQLLGRIKDSYVQAFSR